MYTCYLLTNENNTKTYFGSTMNLKRRLRQHRGEISGGAKYTSTFKMCYLVAYISGFPCKRSALSFEWYTKKNRMKKIKHLFLNLKGKIPNKISKLCHPVKHTKFQHIRLLLRLFVSPKYNNLKSDLVHQYGICLLQ